MLMRLLSVFILAVALAPAATISVSFDSTGTPTDVSAISIYSTYGDMMAGMTVTAYFSDGTWSTAIWAATGSQSGSATTSLFTLSQSGDTFTHAWTLTNTNRTAGLTSIQISAWDGGTVFDTIIDPVVSPGSQRGWPATYQPNGPGNHYPSATAIYSDLVTITGYSYGGTYDLYSTLAISFTEGRFLCFDQSVSFIADTDKIVPEPSTLACFAIGSLLLLAGLRRHIHH